MQKSKKGAFGITGFTLTHATRWLVLVLFLVPWLVGCAGKGGTGSDARFEYEINQAALKNAQEQPPSLGVEEDSVLFSISFAGGGGKYDRARFQQSGDLLRIILYDADFKLVNMKVLYQLSGKISGLKGGDYRIQVENSEGEVIFLDNLTVP